MLGSIAAHVLTMIGTAGLDLFRGLGVALVLCGVGIAIRLLLVKHRSMLSSCAACGLTSLAVKMATSALVLARRREVQVVAALGVALLAKLGGVLLLATLGKVWVMAFVEVLGGHLPTATTAGLQRLPSPVALSVLTPSTRQAIALIQGFGKILRRVGMSLRAMGLAGVLCPGACASQGVLFLSHWFQMVRVHAGRVAAQVVNSQAFRDGASIQLPSNPVSAHRLVPVAGDPIASRPASALPKPAAGSFVLQNLGFKSLNIHTAIIAEM